MSTTVLEKRVLWRLFNELDEPFERYTPGFRAQVFKKGKIAIDISAGETWDYYDLASLTKQIFTVPAIMNLVSRRQVDLDQELHHYLWWWPHSRVTVRQLLNQTSGLEWWRPFYKELKNERPGHSHRWNCLKSLLMECAPSESRSCIYSDINFLLLGAIVEELNGQDLDRVWEKMATAWRVPKIHFNRENKPRYARSLYAPTEKCPWRKKILKGEVHDDNCWSLGGVSSHAGLFGRIEDVAKWGLLVRRSALQASGSPLASHALFKKFTARSVPREIGDWGLGFWKKSDHGSTSGRYFSPASFGGTGFTGTSFWFDPKADILILILSNRVHPTRKNMRFKELRPKLHDIIREELDEAGF